LAAWAGELSAFNEALDDQAYHQHMLANKEEEDDDDADDDDDDEEADLKALRAGQEALALTAEADAEALEASLRGPQLSCSTG